MFKIIKVESEPINDLAPIDPDAPIAAWVKNEQYQEGHLVYQPPSVLKKINGVIYDLTKVKMLLNARIDVDNPRIQANFILGQNTECGMIPILSLGNISLIQGKAKARKGFLAGLIMSTLISKSQLKDNKLTAIPLDTPKRKMVIIDTEQSEDDVAKATKRILRLSGCDKKDIITLFSRGNSMSEKLEILELELQGRTDILFILIDGLVDMVDDPNKFDISASLITNGLLPLSARLDCHITSIVHENKRDEFSRGMLGLIYTQKAQAVFKVEKLKGKEKTTSSVEAGETRGKSFEGFLFEIVDDLPHYIDGFESKKEESAKSPLSVQVGYPTTTHDKIINEVFERGGEEIPNNQFRNLLTITLRGFGVKATGKEAISVWITYYETTYKKIFSSGATTKKVFRRYRDTSPIPLTNKLSQGELL